MSVPLVSESSQQLWGRGQKKQGAFCASSSVIGGGVGFGFLSNTLELVDLQLEIPLSQPPEC